MRELVITSTHRPAPEAYFGPADAGFLNWETLLWRFAAEKSYWLATQGKQPHCMPVWGIWQQASFRFSTHPNSKKAANLRQCPFACVHLANPEAVLIMECNVEQVIEDHALQAFVDDYNPKYNWQFTKDEVRGGVFALTPYKAFAWADGEGERFSNTATRWTFNTADINPG